MSQIDYEPGVVQSWVPPPTPEEQIIAEWVEWRKVIGTLRDEIEIYRRTGEHEPVMGTISQPAAGADFSAISVPNRLWKLGLLFGKLVTSSAVATRVPQVIIQNIEGDTVAKLPAPSTQAASLTQFYTWGIDILNQSVTGTDVSQSLPDLWLPPGAKIVVTTAAIDVADQWSLGATLLELK